jgi:hypothetical protein
MFVTGRCAGPEVYAYIGALRTYMAVTEGAAALRHAMLSHGRLTSHAHLIAEADWGSPSDAVHTLADFFERGLDDWIGYDAETERRIAVARQIDETDRNIGASKTRSLPLFIFLDRLVEYQTWPY